MKGLNMNRLIFRLSFLIGLLASVTIGEAMAKEPPVAKLVQVEGTVEYTRNGTKWNVARGTKYLFAGYKIRTGADGSGKLISESTGESQELGSSSEVEIAAESIILIQGKLTEPEEESTSLYQSLMNKFATAQRYTTVRRAMSTGEEPCDSKVKTIRSLTLSPSHQDLVWRNACPEFSYRLVIDGGKSIEISGQSTSEMIRHPVSNLTPGEHSYRVEVLDKDGTVFSPKKDSDFVYLSLDAEKEVLGLVEQFGDDVFLVADLFEQKGMYVAAMDAYRQYFSDNPDDNDMRPLLIQSYQELKLSNLKDSEARLYNAALEENN